MARFLQTLLWLPRMLTQAATKAAFAKTLGSTCIFPVLPIIFLLRARSQFRMPQPLPVPCSSLSFATLTLLNTGLFKIPPNLIVWCSGLGRTALRPFLSYPVKVHAISISYHGWVNFDRLLSGIAFPFYSQLFRSQSLGPAHT